MENLNLQFDDEVKVLTVSQITGSIKNILEKSLSQVSVIGEISNFKDHVSGHWYFTLKDGNSQISCTMWKSLNNSVYFTPQNGMKIIVKGRVTVYPPRGSYQIDVKSMSPAGEGELQAAFDKLKRKLFNEGLFEEEHKKELVRFPKKIGIVTAIDGAAFRDMISVAKRRYPIAELLIAPSKVQGEGASDSIVKSIIALNNIDDVDLIIVGRGGGSIEDLWAFNEEKVIRAIFNSQKPIVTGIGHEVDFTISDFVSDLRAATPSSAIEVSTPDSNEIMSFISQFFLNTTQTVENLILQKKDFVKNLLESYSFRRPADKIAIGFQTTDNLLSNLNSKINFTFMSENNKLDTLTKSLNLNSIDRILNKGFSLIKQDSEIIKNSKEFDDSKSFTIKFCDKDVEINNE